MRHSGDLGGVHAVRTSNLGKRYGIRGPWVLRKVQFDLPPGSRTALLGPNGVGKTTLLRCLVGLEHPSEGSSSVGGLDPVRRRRDVLRRIGYLPQEAPLYPELTVETHLRLAASLRPSFDKDRALRDLDALDISPSARVGRMSGGQRARTALAIVLALRAPILFLDEPTASLDPLIRREILAHAADRAQVEGTTLIVATHNISDLEVACDRLTILAPGRVLLDTTIEEARSRHSVLAQVDTNDDVVGRLVRADGTRASLVRVEGGGDATLDDIVLGYFATIRQSAA